MIRLRPLRPREQRNLRHWAMELVVVVVGVLLALWAQEWVERRREAQAHEASLEALNREILIMQAAATRPIAVDACVGAQFDRLREMLEADEETWPGLVAPGRIEREGRMEGPINYPTNSYSEEAVRRARETGALESLPPEIATAYEEIFYVLRRLDQVHTDMKKVLAHLKPLSSPRRLSADKRLDMLEQLALFDQYRAIHQFAVEFLGEQTQIIGIEMSDEAAAEFVLRPELEAYGDCLQDVDRRTGKAVRS